MSRRPEASENEGTKLHNNKKEMDGNYLKYVH